MGNPGKTYVCAFAENSTDNTLRTVTGHMTLFFSILFESNRWTITALIRFFTFSKLEIRHTCCNIELLIEDTWTLRQIRRIERNEHTPKLHPLYSSKEAKNIHDEDRHLISVLNRLVPEFDKAYDDFKQPFDIFLDSVMLPRIDQVLRELAREDHEQFSEGRRALGVIMEPIQGHVSDEEAESDCEDEEEVEDEGRSSEEEDL